MSITVTAGMTLWEIAQRYLGSGLRWHELKGFNGDPRHMPIGTVIYLPNEVGGPPTQGAQGATPGQTEAEQWAQINPQYQNELTALEHDFEKNTNFSMPVSKAQLIQMAQNGVNTMYEFAQTAWAGMSAQQQENQPWAQFGMSHDEFSKATQSYGDVFRELTGATPSADVLTQALKDTQGRADTSHFSQWLQNDKSMKETYGWMQYGMNSEQFQQFKTDNKAAFGKDLSDKEAVNILGDQHRQKVGGSGQGSAGSEARITQGQSGKDPAAGVDQAAVR